jgi:hypothetical protein
LRALSRSFSVNPAIQSLDELCGAYTECIANAKQRPNSNGSPRLDLLPMAGGKAKSDHVLLRISLGLPLFLYSLAKSSKELPFVDHTRFVGKYSAKHHERISWEPLCELMCGERICSESPTALSQSCCFTEDLVNFLRSWAVEGRGPADIRGFSTPTLFEGELLL